MDGSRNVSALDDLLLQETNGVSAGPVVRYRALPAGSVTGCTRGMGSADPK